MVMGVRNERCYPANSTHRGDDLRQTLSRHRTMNPTEPAHLVTASDWNRSGAALAGQRVGMTLAISQD